MQRYIFNLSDNEFLLCLTFCNRSSVYNGCESFWVTEYKKHNIEA